MLKSFGDDRTYCYSSEVIVSHSLCIVCCLSRGPCATAELLVVNSVIFLELFKTST